MDQIPSIVSRLQRTGSDGSFVVFMFSIPGNHDEMLPNLQYSIENGRLGLDWVLMAPQNIKDDDSVAEFLKRRGYSPSKREGNDVRYLRVEDEGVENVGLEILRDFYHLLLTRNSNSLSKALIRRNNAVETRATGAGFA